MSLLTAFIGEGFIAGLYTLSDVVNGIESKIVFSFGIFMYGVSDSFKFYYLFS